MAFIKKDLCGNVGSSNDGSTLYSYGTLDNRGDVTTAGYFSTRTTELVLTVGDIINVSAADGFVVLLVTTSTPGNIVVKQTMAEV